MNLQVNSMTTAEKLAAMEQLWESLQSQHDLSPPEWHAEILQKRNEKIAGGEVTFSTLEEVRTRLESRNS